VIVLTIPECTPSLNKLLGQHWAHKHATRNRWRWLVKAACLEAKVFERPNYPRARITVERTGGRLLDCDNAFSGLKFLLDALKHEGFIEDDDPPHIGQPELRQIIDKKLRRTVVKIEGVGI